MSTRILRFKQLRERVPFSRMHIDRLEKAGKFPKRVRIGENSVGWLENEVEAWIASRAAARQPPGHEPGATPS
ncbi:helix-turn-helix transcriptional regulator [Azospirillum argentinense]|uniref:AlpA family phage regulatory protein n=1 Tax=Azospirillum brasilense TaxID=192 RepID=A0A4D8Q5B5_AZOBR|nr:AlpA family phage regulatory protein [Azospirillum argentinense]QCO05475.1 AlpA family phage regulatory protein [Azospirillum argentinense]